jgi:hypothetical protein
MRGGKKYLRIQFTLPRNLCRHFLHVSLTCPACLLPRLKGGLIFRVPGRLFIKMIQEPFQHQLLHLTHFLRTVRLLDR